MDAAVSHDGAGSDLEREVARRRTFAIISHPDAGKTTLTEKLLLLGGAIHLAGQVKARGERRRTRSDWMSIEQQRGISVSTAVMRFDYDGHAFNLLDTPGHEDFSEDTYRTLTAVDAAIMVLDAANGIETQTRKLFEVCRLRDIPIVTFINKIDREGQDAFQLLDEIQETLALDATPMSWPVGMGGILQGMYDLAGRRFLPYARHGEHPEPVQAEPAEIAERLPADQAEQFLEEAELVQEACPAFDAEAFRAGTMTPVFFGSALKEFGVEELLWNLGRMAPPPRTQPAEPAPVEPTNQKVSGFVFKVQANMDPNHRDRVAYFRLCSGRFERGMKLKQPRTGKTTAVHNPIMFFAQDRDLAEEAWPGDILGIPNHGTLRVGDTLSERSDLRFTGIPNFAPEILRRVRLADPMRAKHLQRALTDLAEEGVTQVFRPVVDSSYIVGVVGQLQLDVLAQRIETEYKVQARFEPSPFDTCRWVTADDEDELQRFIDRNRSAIAEDRDGAPVYMARNFFDLNRIQEENPKIRFSATRER
ncbi:peptide chain release factor 3 [Limimonas halophila]|uniref:Peptide chain release factor 3 n=1 Tax=Limimonas halophila TaxID=1082479 RepID=A0A1G7NZB6_9PROT|nr:peptide chain release factor 3 [Limimonas halophila]SDF79323.1 peptide chain release factor 3 [Limimonas halophila]